MHRCVCCGPNSPHGLKLICVTETPVRRQTARQHRATTENKIPGQWDGQGAPQPTAPWEWGPVNHIAVALKPLDTVHS